MTPDPAKPHVAFAGDRRIASGPLSEVAVELKKAVEAGLEGRVLVFEESVSKRIDLDLRGSLNDVRARYPEASDAELGPKPRRGRPRLGVVAKEVTLLPRHWAWLRTQRGGASAALRRLVDRARRESVDDDRVRHAQDAAYHFMSATLGNEAGFEEATRALYARDAERFEAESVAWPRDLRDHARGLAAVAFA